MISTQANRSKFINSCKSFISKYSLDGIDIDMEYPAAMERGGPATDTPSLTAFFKEAKAGLSGKIVSVAAPAGYWFLKGFEIDKVVDHVDYINMMSYDFHGAWDKDVDDEDGTAKPHTSSLDIMDAISLYTRAKVDLSKVNLGMAWYGRTYAVGGCKGIGCKFSTGGKAGKCTGESSIKSQTEIWDEIKANNIKPTYDTKSHTYWYNHNSDFVTYDDTDSWKHKTEMAGKYCFGGTFVW
ncbi:glycoside hydrolase [Pterulicium gracile]|uniref:Glycoside hydrolase n=1 Tax=Pterulicium gracile TaxID=1884261 RepID=A0A5C3QUA9_9AGAR|nr:glycoside hydrolase [Pterula gracilis]